MSKSTDAVRRRSQSRQTLMYGAILVMAALLLILLSHFMNSRGEKGMQAMLREASDAQTRLEEAQAEIAALRAENDELRAQVERLQDMPDDLT